MAANQTPAPHHFDPEEDEDEDEDAEGEADVEGEGEGAAGAGGDDPPEPVVAELSDFVGGEELSALACFL